MTNAYRLLTTTFSTALFLYLFSIQVHAGSEFTVNYDTRYSIDKEGGATVEQDISLANNESLVYATNYTLLLEGKTPQNVKVLQDGVSLPTKVSGEGGKIRIDISFTDALVGKGKTRFFKVSYYISRFAIRNGQVWELSVPKLASPESIDTYSLTLFVPSSFGEAAYISPQPRASQVLGEVQSFSFTKADLTKAGIIAAFGQFQVFSFDLSYHLQNPYYLPGQTEIALPPDTAFQRVYFEKIDPLPKSVNLDENGNFLASYILDPNQNLDVEVKVRVQVFAQSQDSYPRTVPNEKNNYFLSESQYWQKSDPAIQDIASRLETPRDIYNYVTKFLKYDFTRVNEGVKRLGASQVVKTPDKAVCIEFTDLFIALARARGIPAREVNGYGYTKDPKTQPLSLIADVLHSWPEYWDEQASLWRPVDPTWENTTGGVDFFDKFDLSHITFAIHGTDVNYPLPAGAYKGTSDKKKDVQVQFGSLPEQRTSQLKLNISENGLFIPFLPIKLEVTAENSGPVSLYNQPVYFNGTGVRVLSTGLDSLDFIAPYDKVKFHLSIKTPLITSGEPFLSLEVGDSRLNYNLPKGKLLLVLITTVFTGILVLLGIMFIFMMVIRFARKKLQANAKSI